MNGWLISFVITATVTACAPLKRQTYCRREPAQPARHRLDRSSGR
jgi:hypothetical protein